MAELGYAFDATQVEPQGDYTPVKPGYYNMYITESEMKATKAGNGHYLSLKLEVVDGEYAKRVFFDNLNLDNPNQQAVEIAQRTLSSICHAIGVMKVKDSEELHYKPMLVKVGIEEDQNGNPKNVVKGYKKDDGSAAYAEASGGSQATTQATKAKAPWEK